MLKRLLIAIFLLLPSLSWGETYYIGSDPSDDYVSYAAFRAAHTEAAGDVVSFRKGEIFREALVLPTPGTSNDIPITYTSHGTGNNPSIRPVTLVDTWTNTTDAIYTATVAEEAHSSNTLLFVNGVFYSKAHLPNTANHSTPAYYSPSANGSATTIVDTVNLDGVAEADIKGATIAVKINSYTWKFATVTGFDAATSTVTFSPTVSVTTTASTPYFFYGLPSMVDEAGEWAIDTATHTVTLWMADDSDPNEATVEMSGLADYGIYSTRSYIVFRNLDLRYASKYGLQYGGSAHDIVVDGVTSSYNGYAGRYYGAVTNVTDSNGTSDYDNMYGIYALNTTGTTVSGQTVTNHGKWPMLELYNPVAGIGVIGSASTVSGNTVTNSAHYGVLVYLTATGEVTANAINGACQLVNDCGGIYTTTASDGTCAITNNTVSSVTGTNNVGVYLDETAAGWTVSGNNISTAYTGILSHMATGNTIRQNTVNGYTYCGIYLSSSTDEVVDYNVVDSGSDTGVKFGVYALLGSGHSIYNNTVNRAYHGIWNSGSTITNLKNNIVTNNQAYGVRVTDDGAVTNFDYNLLYGNITNNYNGILAGPHDVITNPRFTSTTNLCLLPGSPAINAGADVSLTSDMEGRAVPQELLPDIGAYEYIKGQHLKTLNPVNTIWQ